MTPNHSCFSLGPADHASNAIHHIYVSCGCKVLWLARLFALALWPMTSPHPFKNLVCPVLLQNLQTSSPTLLITGAQVARAEVVSRQRPFHGVLFALSDGRDAKTLLESVGMSQLEADGVIDVADKAVMFGVAKPIQRLEATLEAMAEKQQLTLQAMAEKQQLTLQAMAEKQQSSMNTLIILTGAIILITFPSSPYFSAL